jgi:hypothetical protein
MLKKSSPLIQLGQMEPNLAGSIHVRSKPGIDGPCVCQELNIPDTLKIGILTPVLKKN